MGIEKADNSKFEFIEKLKPKERIEVYLILLVELGGTLQIRKNQFSQYWIPKMASDIANIELDIDYLKEKLRRLLYEPRND